MQEGLKALEIALVGTPANWVVSLMAPGVHVADESASPPSHALSPSRERLWSPSPLGQALKRAHHSPIPTLASPKEDESTSQVVYLPSGPPKAIAGPLESYTLLMGLKKGPLVPYHIPKVTLPPKAFSHFNLKGCGKMHLCGQCSKGTSNSDSGVPLPQETLGSSSILPPI